jgi:hypothetical protein
MYLVETLGVQNLHRALQYGLTGCALGDGKGCTVAAFYFLETSQDRRAAEFLERACDGGDPGGCHLAGKMSGGVSGLVRLLQACSGKIEAACVEADRVLAKLKTECSSTAGLCAAVERIESKRGTLRPGVRLRFTKSVGDAPDAIDDDSSGK